MSRKKTVYPLWNCFGIRDPKKMASKEPYSTRPITSEENDKLRPVTMDRQDLLTPNTSGNDNSQRRSGTSIKPELKFTLDGDISDSEDDFDCEGGENTGAGVNLPRDMPDIQVGNEEDSKGPPLPVKKRDKSHSYCPLPVETPKVYSVEEDNVDDQMKPQARRHRGGRAGRYPHNPSGIDVKYTKVFGESDGAYKNDSVPRGLVFMCNFTNYEGDAHPERKGSQIDFDNLLSLFHQLGYETIDRYCKSGYITKDYFQKMLREFSQEKKHDMLCSCIIIIMSHGSGPKTFITSDNKEVDLMEVYEMLDNINCEKLKGKPKIFILQFCRSAPKIVPNQENLTSQVHEQLRSLVREEIQNYFEKRGNGEAPYDIEVRSPRFLSLVEKSNNGPSGSFSFGEQDINDSTLNTTTNGAEGGEASGENTTSPYQADTKHIVSHPPCGVQRFSDMYSIFSTASGELSQRDPTKGSLLIQAICHVFAEYAYQDEIDIMVRKVSQYMIKILQRDDPIHVPRQTCERTNNGLDKYFYFNPVKLPLNRYVTI